MSILNHSIPSIGQPLLPPKSSTTQDASQSSHRAHTTNPFKSNSSQKGSSLLNGLTLPVSESEKFVRIENIVLSVSVSSAVKLDSKQVELISRRMQKLTGFRNLKIENVVDPTLIAGFTITCGGDESNVIDLSVKGQLAALAARVESSERRITSNVQLWSSPTT